jgi:hypothetical protein
MSGPARFITHFKPENVQVQPLTLNPGGKGKTAWLNMKDNVNLFQGEDFKVSFSVKPGMNDTKLTSFTKMNLTLQIGDEPEHQQFTDKARALESAVVRHFFEKKNQVWPDKAKFFSDESALMGMFNPFVKDGKMSADGKAYKPSVTLKLENLGECVERLVVETKDKADGTKEEQVTEVIWKNSIVKYKTEPVLDEARRPVLDEAGKPKTKVVYESYPEKLPKFFLHLGKDESGGDIVTQKIDVKREDGTNLLDSNGLKVRRWVGPQDIKVGSVVRPAFRVKKVYLVQSFGIHAYAEAMIIKPPPPREVAEFSNVKIVEEADPYLAAKAISALENVVDVEAGPEEEDKEDVPKEDVPIPEAILAPKRKAEEEPVKEEPKKKKKKTED